MELLRSFEVVVIMSGGALRNSGTGLLVSSGDVWLPHGGWLHGSWEMKER